MHFIMTSRDQYIMVLGNPIVPHNVFILTIAKSDKRQNICASCLRRRVKISRTRSDKSCMLTDSKNTVK